MNQFEQAYSTLVTKRKDQPQWVGALRQPAFEHVVAKGFPTRAHEEWKYTNVKPITELSLSLATEVPAIDEAFLAQHKVAGAMNLVFVDGVLASKYSDLSHIPAGMVIDSLADSLQQEDSSWKQKLEVKAEDNNVFLSLNQAFLQNGCLIRVQRNQSIKAMVHLLFVHSHQESRASFPRTVIQLESSSNLTVLETHVGGDNTYFANPVTDLEVGENAALNYYRAQLDGAAAYHVGIVKARIERDARLESFSFSIGAKLCRNDINVTLSGEGSFAGVDGLYLANNDQHVDHHTSIDHKVPHASSSQLYKGILHGESRGVFSGKIFVRKDAQQTQAFQLNKNLLLSKTAEIDTKPQLEIDANDVKCSHGATIGRLGQDEYFYLLSRGIAPALAERMLAESFAVDVLHKISNQTVRDRFFKQLAPFFGEAT